MFEDHGKKLVRVYWTDSQGHEKCSFLVVPASFDFNAIGERFLASREASVHFVTDVTGDQNQVNWYETLEGMASNHPDLKKLLDSLASSAIVPEDTCPQLV